MSLIDRLIGRAAVPDPPTPRVVDVFMPPPMITAAEEEEALRDALEELCRYRYREALRQLDAVIHEAHKLSKAGFQVNPAYMADKALDVRNTLVKAGGEAL